MRTWVFSTHVKVCIPENTDGVYVMDVPKDGAAYAAGIKKGDVIVAINEVPITSGAEMVGQIATFRPGDKISITYKRNGKEITSKVTLRNSTGTEELVKSSIVQKLGADLATLSKEQADELGVSGGVEIKAIGATGLLSKVRVSEGFVILKANNQKVNSVDDFKKVLESAGSSVKVEGIYPGYEGVYNFVLNLDSVR